MSLLKRQYHWELLKHQISMEENILLQCLILQGIRFVYVKSKYLEKTSEKLKDVTDKNSIECHKNIDLAS